MRKSATRRSIYPPPTTPPTHRHCKVVPTSHTTHPPPLKSEPTSHVTHPPSVPPPRRCPQVGYGRDQPCAGYAGDLPGAAGYDRLPLKVWRAGAWLGYGLPAWIYCSSFLAHLDWILKCVEVLREGWDVQCELPCTDVSAALCIFIYN